jgi:hypothetical protein
MTAGRCRNCHPTRCHSGGSGNPCCVASSETEVPAFAGMTLWLWSDDLAFFAGEGAHQLDGDTAGAGAAGGGPFDGAGA